MNKHNAECLPLKIRIGIVEEIKARGFGHIGGSLSVADALAVLYGEILRTDPANPKWPDRDEVVFSKGHAGPAEYAALAAKGFIPWETLRTLNQPGTNMAGVAAGLAAAGFKSVIHFFGPFASRRCFDQIFLSGGYAHNDITVIGSDPGVCATFNGSTHMPFEDVALYRVMPTATIIDVTDGAMLQNVPPKPPDISGVKYLRVGRRSGKRGRRGHGNRYVHHQAAESGAGG